MLKKEADMTKDESYVQEYPKLNKAYNQIFDSLQILIEAEDSDSEVCSGVNSMLVYFDQILDVVKSERDEFIAAQKEKSKESTERQEEKSGGKKGKFKVF